MFDDTRTNPVYYSVQCDSLAAVSFCPKQLKTNSSAVLNPAQPQAYLLYWISL
jgi:hypothetical protein